MEYGEKYYLGLDMGTSSVGWAVTDEKYQLRRAKGKDLWGSRLFDEAKPAADRRSHRTARRRGERERAKIALLTDFFADEIDKIDPDFFVRLAESKYHIEDRSEENHQKYGIFNDAGYNDTDYFKEYPTIFHLRSELIHNKEPHDVRLLYLALLNMFKHRGNFLNASLDTGEDIVAGMEDAWHEFVTEAELYGISFDDTIDPKMIEEILSEKGVSRSVIGEKLCGYLCVSKKEKNIYEILQLIVGKTGKLANIYNTEDIALIDDDHNKLSLCFRDASYDEKSLEVQELIGDEYFSLISAAKQVHDIGLLANITRGFAYLSDARVDLYNSHQEDLERLKRVFKKYDMSLYNKLFRVMADGNYSAYVGSVYSHGKRVRRNLGKGRSSEDLYNTIKACIKKLPEDVRNTDTDITVIMQKIEAEVFLPKQLTSANGVIPNQVHVREMRTILKNAEEYLSFLSVRDDTGLSVSDKILKLFSFKIPYYVGPIGQQYVDQKGYNVWAVRKAGEETGRVYPWNFEDKIDTRNTAEKFIARMVRRCSYLNEERTLPKTSLMYEKFMVLNELNSIKVNGERISVALKQQLFNELFVSGKKVSIKGIEAFFKRNGVVKKEETGFISGIDVEGGFKASLSSLGKFVGLLGDAALSEDNQGMIEEIIFWGTIFGEDRKFIRESITEKYGNILSKDQIKKIANYKFVGWGKLSKEFLELMGQSGDGIERSIIAALWETNYNLMELMSDKYTYCKALEDRTNSVEKELSDWEPTDLDDMYLSAPVKRMVWQTLKIIKELVEVTGRKPDRIFVEMAREDGEKGKRTDSRKKKLINLYAGIGKDGKAWKDEIDKLTDAELRQKKLYLYYCQMGKCMYTGEKIDLHTLLTDNTSYDIDHIYPQHFIKDDSIENNKVLVKKQLNATKSDSYPISSEIRKKMYPFWSMLCEKGFITKEKFARLTRSTEFTDEEKAKFISRQLVETRQGTKVITQILQQAIPGVTVVFSKAGEVSDFRKEYDILKVRSINELHHAKDAYLNIVVGNTYYVKFTNNPMNFIKEASKRPLDDRFKYNMKNIFLYDVASGNEIAWTGTKDKSSDSLMLVKKTMHKNSVLLTKRTYIAHGGFTGKDTVYPAKDTKPTGYIAMSADPRLSDVAKYGGRTSISTMCYCLVEYKLNGKKVLSFESIPIYFGNIETVSEDKLLRYLEKIITMENTGKLVSDIVIKYRCIPFNSMLKLDSYFYLLGGKTENNIYVHNMVPLMLEDKYAQYIKELEKANDRSYYEAKNKDGELIITREKNIELYNQFRQKFESTIYGSKKGSIKSHLESGESKFAEIEISDQVYTLLQIVLWFGVPCVAIDLSRIDGGKAAGYSRIGKNIIKAKEACLITNSVTGIYQHSIDLLSL